MENLHYLHYYDGLSFQRLIYHDRWLILCIEAASYCKSFGVKDIGYSELRSICSDRLRGFTKGTLNLSSGSFNTALKTALRKGFVKVEKKTGAKKRVPQQTQTRKKTRIIPRVSLIEKELESRKREDAASREMRLRFLGPDDTGTRNRSPPRESVAVSEGIGVVVTRAPRI
jgi:hypothetical protein